MPTEAVLMHLANAEELENLQMQVILQSAPVLKNVKMSCMFAVPGAYLKTVSSFFAGTNISVRCLCQRKGRAIILVYREEQLADYLRDDQVAMFLRQFGYYGDFLREYLTYLGERFSYYYNQEGGFPHEMGIFLGYPLEDVKGFIAHGGKNCCFTGYWKVYSNVEHAKQKFQAFDMAKEAAVNEFFSGKNVWEIAC